MMIEDLEGLIEEKILIINYYLNYYPKDRRVILEIFNAAWDGTQDEIEIIGEAKDFLIKEIENWCEDYRQCTPMEMIEQE